MEMLVEVLVTRKIRPEFGDQVADVRHGWARDGWDELSVFDVPVMPKERSNCLEVNKKSEWWLWVKICSCLLDCKSDVGLRNATSEAGLHIMNH